MPTYVDSAHGRLVVNFSAPTGYTDSTHGRLVTTLTVPPSGVPYLDSTHGRLVTVMGVVVNPLPVVNDIEPETMVAVNTTLVGGAIADSWTWRQISGPTVTLLGSGSGQLFRAPSLMVSRVPQPCTIVLGVKATTNAIDSAEINLTFNVLPNQRWMLVGSTWVGKQPPTKINFTTSSAVNTTVLSTV